MAAIAPAPPLVEIPLTLFGGADPELAPADCPEGVSPDNQDMIFLPGTAASREGLHKLYPTIAGTPTITYQKSYIKPDNTVLTLVLDSNGVLWQEDVTNNPAVLTQIGSTVKGLWAQSASAFGKEYLAVSDLLHGQAVPLQYNGAFLDRVTQDGPGAAPFASDFQQPLAIEASPNGLANILAHIPLGGLSEVGGLCTVANVPLGSAAPAIQSGDPVTIAGAGVAGYDGTFTIASVTLLSPTKISFTYINATTGLAPSGGGTVAFGLTTLTLAAGETVGQLGPLNGNVTIAGASIGGYDGNWPVRLSFGPGSNRLILVLDSRGFALSGDGTVASAGLISPGIHQLVQMFLTRSGYLTKPSPVFSWTAAGSNGALVSNLAIGPGNVVARVLAMTGAGGDNFFTELVAPQIAGQIVGTALIIPDNTSTSVVINIADNSLFAGIPIDIVGNDLFDQVVLGTPLGFFEYGSRLFTWGDYQKIENLLNLGFCGGVENRLAPDGWTVETAGGLLDSQPISGQPCAPWYNGYSWQITGDGTANPKGRISQSAYQDSFGAPILQPNTGYILRLWAISSAVLTGLGSIVAELYSATGGGVLASASIPVTAMNLAVPGSFLTAPFSALTPATIPSDTVLRIYAVNLPNTAYIDVAEIEIVFAQDPYRNSLARVSYVNNPEAFAQTTGNLGPADDTSPLRCFSLQRNYALLKSGVGTHSFQQNDGEPDTWSVNQISRSVGAMSLRGGDPGQFGTGDAAEDWDVSADEKGMYLFAGGDFWKISQEFQTYWDQINQAAQHTVVLKNDPLKRRIYCAIPIGAASAPNLILVMDYRELDTSTQIAGAPPIHITLTGMMKSSDLTRKWTRWNLSVNTIEVLVRPGNVKQLSLGAGNGLAPGMSPGFGNVYFLDPAKLTDDDYGQIFPSYTTYFFVNHDQEEQMGLATGRKLAKKVTMYITGVGLVSFVPLVDSINNALPQSSTRQLVADTSAPTALAEDLEWTTGIRGQRIAFKVSVAPLPGMTDVKMSLQKLVVSMMRDPMAFRLTSNL